MPLLDVRLPDYPEEPGKVDPQAYAGVPFLPGLLSLSASTLTNETEANPAKLRFHRRDEASVLGEFRLMQLGPETARWDQPEVLDVSQGTVAELQREMPLSWYWVQRIEGPDTRLRTDSSIWIWDATLAPEDDHGKILVAVVGRMSPDQSWKVLYRRWDP